MWNAVIVLTLMTAVDPVRLGVNLLLISRPRPMLTLLAYWVGCLLASVPAVLVPLMVLHLVPMLTRIMATTATLATSHAQPAQIGIGALALVIAALIAAGFPVRQRVGAPTRGGNPSTLTSPPSTPNALSRLLRRAQDASSTGGSAFWRLLARAQNAWDSGHPWVALVVGIGSGPPPVEWLFVMTAIVASGAAIGAQVGAALVFAVGMNGVVEIMLISYLLTPARTEAAMMWLHNVVRSRRRQLLVAIFAVLGISLVISGIGSG